MGVFNWLSNRSSIFHAPAPASATDVAPVAATAGGVTTVLPDGDYVVSSETSNGASDYTVHTQLYSPHGAPIGPAFAATAPPISLFTAPAVTGLADGSYEAAWVQQANYSSQLLVEHFSAQGEALGQATLADYGGFSVIGRSGYALAGMPDGDFVAAWTVQDTSNAGSPAQVYAGEFTPSGSELGSATLLGSAASPNPAPGIETQANGHYVVSWTSPTGPESQAFADPAGSPPQALGSVNTGHTGAVATPPVSTPHAGGAIWGASDWLPAHAGLLHPLVAAVTGFAEAGHMGAALGGHGWGASFV